MTDRPLRFLTVADVPPDPNSGAAGTVYHTNAALRELGHEVDEIWADDLGPRRIAHGNLHSLLEQPRAYRREAMKAVARKEYDVIELDQPQSWLAAKALKQSGFQGLVINRSHGVELRADVVLREWQIRLRIPESRFPRSLLAPTMRRLLQRQWPAVVRWSDGIITGCELDREFLIEKIGVNSNRVRAIHHGVADVFLETRQSKRHDNRWKRVLHVGQYAFFKGALPLIEIVNTILLRCEDVTFTWVCAGSFHDSIRKQLDAKILDRVSLVDSMPIHELLALYDSHGLFVFPTLFEGFGKAPFEAMARGMCVVTTAEGGMRDLIADGVNGYLCPRGDVAMFVARVRSLLEDLTLPQSLSSTARETASTLTWQRCAGECVAVFYELLLPANGKHYCRRFPETCRPDDELEDLFKSARLNE